MSRVDEECLEVLFRAARSQNRWLEGEVTDAQLHEIHDILKWGPTSANGWPLRVVYARSQAAKERLAGTAMSGNQEKILAAPVTAILAYDLAFYERMDELFPHNPGMADLFRNDAGIAEITAFRNSTLQCAYFMLAARAVGLDCGPMSGFDNAKCDELFLEGSVRSNMLCSIGRGDPEGLFQRLPRPSFDDVSQVL